MQKLLEIIGNNIRTIRRGKNIKQEDLAIMVGLKKGAMSKIENGKIINVTIARLGKITDALGITLADLFIESKQEVNTDN